MIPTGDFEDFRRDILYSYLYYSDDITFGILLADPRQTEAREYILNYLDIFNNKFEKIFNFFIPGYCQVNYKKKLFKTLKFTTDNNRYCICKGYVNFLFDEVLFNQFCIQLEQSFNILYTFNPMLILMSMKPGHLGSAKYIVIELDDNESHSVRRTGQFFEDLFKAIHMDNSLEYITRHIQSKYVKGNLLKSIINVIGNDWLTEIEKSYSEMKRYRIINK